MVKITYVVLSSSPHLGHLEWLRAMRRLGHEVKILSLKRPSKNFAGSILITEGARPTLFGSLLAKTHRCWMAVASSPSILNPIINKLYSAPDMVIAVSSLIRDLIQNNSIILYPRPPELERLLKLPLNQKMPWVCYVGPFIPVKGIHKIPDIAKEVITEVKNKVRFLLIGGSLSDPLGIHVIRKSRVYGIEEFIDIINWLPRSKLFEMLSRCSIYVQPSLFDAFSIAVIEAMVLGSVPIVTKYVGSKDIIHELSADLITDLNPSSIAKIIIKLLTDDVLLRDLGRSAREIVSKNLSTIKLTEEISILINQCLK